jgi:hypothetical protein
VTLAEKILGFHRDLVLPAGLPDGVEVMNPFAVPVTYALASEFYYKYYGDSKPRTLILGINPGRFGAGLTGVPFTDPVKMEQYCGITNDLPKKAELSADFIYQVINGYGGPSPFFSRYYINSVFPLGFTKDGKNLNYYDMPALQKLVMPYCAWSIRTQLDFGLDRDVAFCLGEGENLKHLSELNRKEGFFREIRGLPHPRFIMQYKRRSLHDYLALYLAKLDR